MNNLNTKLRELAAQMRSAFISSSKPFDVHGFILKIEKIALELDCTSGWIPVGERLPDLEVNVLVSERGDSYATEYVEVAQLEENKELSKFYWSTADERTISMEWVEAWQPLPEPYVGGQEKG